MASQRTSGMMNIQYDSRIISLLCHCLIYFTLNSHPINISSFSNQFISTFAMRNFCFFFSLPSPQVSCWQNVVCPCLLEIAQMPDDWWYKWGFIGWLCSACQSQFDSRQFCNSILLYLLFYWKRIYIIYLFHFKLFGIITSSHTKVVFKKIKKLFC